MLHRVLEKKASLRNVADDSGVSQETVRRVVRAARRGYKASVRTDMPRSQHRGRSRLGAMGPRVAQRDVPIE